MSRFTRALIVLLALALVAAACGSDDGDDDSAEGDAGSCDIADLALKSEGQLTVATGEPVFPPWMLDDTPENQMGFESAFVYALAEDMGFAADDVQWLRTGFDEVIAAGSKDFDFNIQQFSATAEREEVVDFSDGYYIVEQALVAAADSPVASATSIADLESARLGAALGTTSLDYIEDVIQPDTEAAVYNDNADAKSAFDAGQVDGLVFDLPTAFFVTAVEIENASIVGVLPRTGDEPEELALLFEDGSGLTGCVNASIARLRDAGTIESLEDEWLNDGGSIPTLSN